MSRTSSNARQAVIAWLLLFSAAVLGGYIGQLWQRGVDHVITLEYLKVILTWPVAALILVLIVVRRFHHAISSFISRAVELSAFGATAKASPLQRDVNADEGPPGQLPAGLPEDVAQHLGEDARRPAQELAALLLGARREARIWEFRYLSSAGLANSTVGVLTHLGQQAGPISAADYTNLLAGYDEGERTAIDRALTRTHLIQKQADGLVRISGKGADFLQFRGIEVNQIHFEPENYLRR